METLSRPSISFMDYEKFIADTMQETDDWRREYSHRLIDEGNEMLDQHGSGAYLIANCRNIPQEIFDMDHHGEFRAKMAGSLAICYGSQLPLLSFQELM